VRVVADNTWARVEGATPAELDWLDGYLTVEPPGAEYSEAYEAGVWDGTVHLFSRKQSRFLAGLSRMVAGRAREAGVAFDFVDSRPSVPGGDRNAAAARAAVFVWLRDYQHAAVQEAIRRGRGILSMPTGSGKTQCFSAIGSAVRCRWLVLVDTKDLMHQAAERYYHLTGEAAGLAGDGEWSPRRYTVATLQTLHKNMGDPRVARLLEETEGVIGDEVQVLSADEFSKVAMACTNAWWRLGFSATPFERSDEADYRAIGILGPLIHDVPPRPLIEAGWLCEPEVFCVRHRHEKMTGSFPVVYEAGVTLNEARNALVRQVAVDRELASRPAMVFFSKLAHGRALDRDLSKYVRTVFVEGASSTRARDGARHQLRIGLRDVLVTSKVFNKGIDIPEVESAVNAAAGASRIDALQKVGRIMRVCEGKPRTVRFFDVYDQGNRWLEAHARARVEAWRSRDYRVRIIEPTDLATIGKIT